LDFCVPFEVLKKIPDGFVCSKLVDSAHTIFAPVDAAFKKISGELLVGNFKIDKVK
jgi:hypothetical protein